MNLFDDSFIRGLCGAINTRMENMDDRPFISNADLKKIRISLAEYAKDKSENVHDFDIIFNFFVTKRFAQEMTLPSGEEGWAINTKFDDEWALNIFSEKIDLLATGVYKLDDVLKGGFRAYKSENSLEQGQLNRKKRMESVSTLLQGRPGSGKTTTALLILCNFACQGYSTLYISAEQSSNSILRTIERFCQKFEKDRHAPSVIICELKHASRSQAHREINRQIETATADEKKAKEKAETEKEKEKQITRKEFIQKLLSEQGEKFKSEFPFKFAVVSIDETTNQEITSEKIKELEAKGIYSLVVTRMGATNEAPIESSSGPFLRTSPTQFLAQFDKFKESFCLAPDWLVIDSVTAFDQLGSRLASYVFQAEETQVSRLLLSENVSRRDEAPTDLEASCDVLLELGERNLQIADVQDSPSNYMQRYLEIKKFRSSPFHRGKHPMAIKSDKVKVYRSAAILLKVTGHKRREEELADTHKSERLKFGIDGLDSSHGLNDGIGNGSFTVLHGAPGSHKTTMCSYFLTSDVRSDRERWLSSSRKNKKRAEDYTPRLGAGRALIYSFTADRRSIVHGMRNLVDRRGPLFVDSWLNKRSNGNAAIEIHDINPGYLFPETFVEDLLDTLEKSKRENDPIRRIVFDSYDAIQAAYPIMRMDQFFWKVISQICCDNDVSALLKVSGKNGGFDGFSNDTSVLLSGIADNTIETNPDGTLSIVATEHRVHNSNRLVVERAMVIEQDSPDRSKVWLRVKA